MVASKPRRSRAAAAVAAPVWVGEGSVALTGRVLRLMAASRAVQASPAEGCEVLVWLATHEADDPAPAGDRAVGRLAEALACCTRAEHVVFVSSAMVYGAWANNPVPLTEDAPVRPDAEFDYARQLLAAEQLVTAWRAESAGRTACILRPAVTIAADAVGRLPSALAAGMGQRMGADDPPAQFLHLDDLASAVVLAAERRLDGVYNVAPDGWVDGERVRALAGAVPRLRLPERVNEVVADLRWRVQRGPIPPGLSGYTRWPWLVANDKLRDEGWRPTVTNEQAYVEGTEARWWTVVSPKRRQELALGGTGLALVAAVLLLVRWLRRDRST